MRRKPYQAAVLLARTDVIVAEPERQRGNWKTLLNCEKLHVEIGSGKGEYWYTMAGNHPKSGWLAIEKNRNIAAIALRKLPQKALTNARYIAQDGKDLAAWFDEKEIDTIHLNFVDPWPKRAHIKRRLTHPLFLEIYRKLLNEGGQVILKTDNQDLMAYSLTSLMEQGYILRECSYNFHSENQDGEAVTEYERKFRELGYPIYRAVWEVVK